MTASPSFQISSNGGSTYAAVNASLCGALALPYNAAGTYSIKVKFDSTAEMVSGTFSVPTADDVHILSLPAVTNAADKTATFSLPKTGGSWIVTGLAVDGTGSTSKSLKIAVLNSVGNEEISALETSEASALYGWVGCFNAVARAAGGGGGSVPLGGANQVYWCDGGTNQWTSNPKVSSLTDDSLAPATAGFIRVQNNSVALAAKHPFGGNLFVVTTDDTGKIFFGSSTCSAIELRVGGSADVYIKHGSNYTLDIQRASDALSLLIDSVCTSVLFGQVVTAAFAAAHTTLAAQDSSDGAGTGGNYTIQAGSGPGRGGDVVLKAGPSAGTPGKLTVKINGSTALEVLATNQVEAVSQVRAAGGFSGKATAFQLSKAAVVYTANANKTATTAQYECFMLYLSESPPGTLTVTRDLVLPLTDGGLWLVVNTTGVNIRVTGTSGATTTVNSSTTRLVGCTGTGMLNASPS